MKSILTVILLLLLLTGLLLFSMWFVDKESTGYIHVDRPLSHPLLEQQEADDMLIFFGYLYCTESCIPKLDELSRIYAYHKGPRSLKVLFINLGINTPEEVQSYVKSFNSAFEGIQLDRDALLKLTALLNVNFIPTDASYKEIKHSDYLYHLQRRGVDYHLREIYAATPLDVTVIENDLSRERP
jgi:cytochrome oxidase Cu insertion factor (SCO1/SenC/PrrC family)